MALLQQAQANGGTDWWVTFGAALGGALAGGVMSALGAVWVNRIELTRTRRIGLYEELLQTYGARVMAAGLNVSFGLPIQQHSLSVEFMPVMRAATVAGWRDRRWARRLKRTIDAIAPLPSTNDPRLDTSDPKFDGVYAKRLADGQKAQLNMLDRQVHEYEAWLAKKVR